jgi:threonine-phosphate decarboxylase
MHLNDHGGTVFATARALGIATSELLDFSASINPLGPPPGVRQAIVEALDSLVHYPESEASELRRAVAEFHGLLDENICLANGSTELIYLLPRLVAGRRALIVAPPFSEYGRALSQAGWEVEHHTLSAHDGFALHLERMALDLAKGYDLLLMANPGNPTGRCYALKEISLLLQLCQQQHCFLVLDEAFMDFCEAESAKSLISSSRDALLLRSLTKFYALPGLRLGFAIGHPDLIRHVASLRMPWSVNTLAQVAGMAALADTGYCQQTLELIKTERHYLSKELGALPALRVFPSAANFLLLELPAAWSARQLQGAFLSSRLLLRDCGNFVGLSDRFIRVAVRSRGENERLVGLFKDILTGASHGAV